VAYVEVSEVPRRFGATSRRDAWWVQLLVVFCGFSAFIVYSTWAAFQGACAYRRFHNVYAATTLAPSAAP
jgi:hypothetical protein